MEGNVQSSDGEKGLVWRFIFPPGDTKRERACKRFLRVNEAHYVTRLCQNPEKIKICVGIKVLPSRDLTVKV